MTEADWLSGRDVYAMLRYLHFLRCFRQRRPADPKVRLLACQCCTVIPHLLRFEGSKQAFRTVEAFSRRSITADELAIAVPFAEVGLDAAETAWRAALGELASHKARAVAWAAEAVFYALGGRAGRTVTSIVWKAGTVGQVLWAVNCALVCDAGTDGAAAGHAERQRQLWLFHELFGNPFRPVSFLAEWRTEAVLGLARAINEGGAFDLLPVLADALEEAGCADEQLLVHCRGLEPHTWGCWGLDMVLGVNVDQGAVRTGHATNGTQGYDDKPA